MSFIQKQNIQMLWDVVSDEDIFRFLTPDIQSKIYQLFLNNIQGFFEVEKTKNTSLVDLNKKYILLILNHIRKTYPYQPSKIKIHNEQPVKELITYEEIQNDRKSKFEKDFSRLQSEFEDSITIKPPPTPDFTDKDNDRPIKEMDKLVKEMQAQRNYEVEQINKHNYNLPSNQIDNWLKPQETSLKTDKFEHNKEQQPNGNRFKFLTDLEPNLSPKKNVSFSDSDQINVFSEIEDDEDINIFSKLKKVNKDENSDEDRLTKLERNMDILNQKIDKIFELMSLK